MSHTQLSPTPQLLADLAAKRKTPTPAPPRPAGKKGPHVTQSNGYAHTYVSPLPATPEIVQDELPTCDLSWMPTAEEVGLGWTPRLRRTTVIDVVDPQEALDAPDFGGFHIFTP